MTAALAHPGVALNADHLIGLRRFSLQRNQVPPLSALPGGLVTRRRGQGQEIADVRAYVSGDDIRHLDRASTARTGDLHIRTFQEDRDRVTVLVADFRPSMLWGSRRAFRSVAAAEALTLIGWRVIHEGGRVGLITLGGSGSEMVTARGRARGMLAVIGGMVRAHQQALSQAQSGIGADPPLAGALSPVSRVAPKGAEVVIASGFDAPGSDLEAELSRMAQRRVPRLIRIEDAATNLPPGLYPVRLPDGTRSRLRISGERRRDPAQGSLAGLAVLCVDAGGSVRDMARRIEPVAGIVTRRRS